jgi:hypothetical protein
VQRLRIYLGRLISRIADNFKRSNGFIVGSQPRDCARNGNLVVKSERTEIVSASNATTAESVEEQKTMWVRIGSGAWFAIPSGMAEAFRKSGADVRQTLPKQS